MRRLRRRGSTVQGIAMSIPLLDAPLQLERGVEDAKSGASIKHRRTKSDGCLEVKSADKVSLPSHLLYPFTELEKVTLWNKEINKFESDLTIDLDDQLLLEDLSMATAIEFQEYLKFTLHENLRFETEAEAIIEKLDELLTINDQVTQRTEEFQSKSNILVTKVDKLTSLQHNLSDKLSFFEALDPIIQTLNTTSSGSIVLKASFQEDILAKLDKCIQFLDDPTSKDFKELSIYKFRFKQCMVRALTLMRNYIISNLREEEQRAQTKINVQKNDDNETSSRVLIDATLYSQFAKDLSKTSILFKRLYQRSSSKLEESEEYFGLLNDCYNQYFKSRGALLHSVIGSTSKDDKDAKSSTSQKIQASLSKFSKLLNRESAVFKRIFFIPESEIIENRDNEVNIGAMNTFFESLVDPLYESLRDQIIRETSIDELCETLGIIEGYFDYDYEDGNTASGISTLDSQTSGMDFIKGGIDYQRLFRPLLEDTESRLVFRVRRYIDTNVLNYQRTGKELSIESRRTRPSDGDTVEPDLDMTLSNTSNVTPLSPRTSFIYPPVLKTVKLLSRIYQLVGQNIFDDMANSIVHLAITSLKSNFDDDVSLESKLYEIKNLMFLKDYMSSFDVEGSSRETTFDFSGLTDLYHTIMGRRKASKHRKDILSLPNTRNPLFAAVPRVVTDFFNCKAEIVTTLRETVHSFIDISKDVFIEPLNSYPGTLDLAHAMDKFMDTLHNELPRLGPQIRDYIDDQQTLYFLVDGLQNEVMEEYQKFYNKAIEFEKSQMVEKLLDEESVLSVWGAIVEDMLGDLDNQDDQNTSAID
ncbi:hypothetical protein FOA43_003394 [Brettanomyces nanus]|uniref:Conserved oligomeric Golgi complex subunit 3 n=1 Tax=Eeniella nana TaxID=13502 RepID=A0A875S4X4_EENNA|nr:uncharacterized protein FOA43_003394 [Brettanomyces nanus]QPG76008.1 hypothetical protein FOA43_003394 [Brettanomyces nanus]